MKGALLERYEDFAAGLQKEIEEDAGLRCGARHFEALRIGEAPAEYFVARTVNDVMTRALAAD